MSSVSRMNPLLAKILLIVLLSVVLLFPLWRVESLVAERSKRLRVPVNSVDITGSVSIELRSTRYRSSR